LPRKIPDKCSLTEKGKAWNSARSRWPLLVPYSYLHAWPYGDLSREGRSYLCKRGQGGGSPEMSLPAFMISLHKRGTLRDRWGQVERVVRIV
jgi:hypothetical protein